MSDTYENNEPVPAERYRALLVQVAQLTKERQEAYESGHRTAEIHLKRMSEDNAALRAKYELLRADIRVLSEFPWNDVEHAQKYARLAFHESSIKRPTYTLDSDDVSDLALTESSTPESSEHEADCGVSFGEWCDCKRPIHRSTEEGSGDG